jgi:hypothetical protein
VQYGNIVAGSGSVAGNANYIYLVPITSTGATTLSDVQFNCSAASSSANFAAILYADNNGVPGELISVGNIVNGVVASTTSSNQSDFLNPPGLIADDQYWIGIYTDTALSFTAASAGAATSAFASTFTNPPPTTAPTAAVLGTGINLFGDFVTDSVIEGRAYTTTYVSGYNEEGPPSPATLLTGWNNGVWTVQMFTPTVDDMGILRNIQFQNLYRTVVGQGGATVYYYVATFRLSDWAYSLTGTQGPWYGGNNNLGSPTLSYSGYTITGLSSSNGTFTDTLPDNYVALNNQLASTSWYPPPENLQGLIALPNGMMAGFVNNEVWFCEPYYPHAWPPQYVLTTEYPIIGLGVTSGALVACTGATPYVFNGVNPSAMTSIKSTAVAPCSSRGSILSGDAAVTYTSPNGLMQVTNSGQVLNTTELWITRENWQQLTPQEYARAIYLASCYFCFGTTSPSSVVPVDNSVAQEGFIIELDQDNTSFTIWPQPGGHRLGFDQLSSHTGYNIDNVLNDPWTGVGLVISNEAVYYYDFTDPLPAMVPYDWKSKIYQANNKKDYSAFRVFFTVPTNTPALSASRNTAPTNDPSWEALGANQYLIVKAYADAGNSGTATGQLKLMCCREVRKSGELMRLPSGFKAEQWMFEILGRVVVSNMQVATSVKELGNV